VTAVTAQNTRGVGTVLPLPPSLVREQIDTVVTDLGAHATKIGMLATTDIARVVAEAIARHALRHVVLDTVLRSTSGAALLDDDGVVVLRGALIPAAEIVTANVPEAEVLTGLRIHTVADSRRAARALIALGARAVVVKGGHLDGAPIDVVDDGREVIELDGERLPGRHTHGTGCTFASAIAARLARGEPPIACNPRGQGLCGSRDCSGARPRRRTRSARPRVGGCSARRRSVRIDVVPHALREAPVRVH
jgi:hydroxymethylpyrimidine/phosphomethylpyrimidine kinase